MNIPEDATHYLESPYDKNLYFKLEDNNSFLMSIKGWVNIGKHPEALLQRLRLRPIDRSEEIIDKQKQTLLDKIVEAF